jgi:predicted RNA-binding Zn-ribbon protein involved in translation (DUF1610 family)
MTTEANTHPVSDEVFRQVYDSPASLPGHHKWVTQDEDVRRIENLLGIPPRTIGAPLWVSGETKHCPQCGREINWLDIVSSALGMTHSREMIARVILGIQKYVNTEVPRAIAGLKCVSCNTRIENIRSFKCHNWVYAHEIPSPATAGPDHIRIQMTLNAELRAPASELIGELNGFEVVGVTPIADRAWGRSWI